MTAGLRSSFQCSNLARSTHDSEKSRRLACRYSRGSRSRANLRLAGDSLNGVTDSIRPRDNIKWVPVDVGMTGLLGFSSAKVNLFR